MRTPSVARQATVLVGLILLCQGAGAAGALLTDPGPGSWYAGLSKPPFNPPPWIFGPVWIALYTAMAVAAWRIWRKGVFEGASTRSALTLFGVQLAVNAAWTPTFFGLEMLLVALGVILIMLMLIVATTRTFWRIDRLAGGLMVPYIAWVAFATVLNASIWWLNRPG
jgi:tryptophan-rich sensory protein